MSSISDSYKSKLIAGDMNPDNPFFAADNYKDIIILKPDGESWNYNVAKSRDMVQMQEALKQWMQQQTETDAGFAVEASIDGKAVSITAESFKADGAYQAQSHAVLGAFLEHAYDNRNARPDVWESLDTPWYTQREGAKSILFDRYMGDPVAQDRVRYLGAKEMDAVADAATIGLKPRRFSQARMKEALRNCHLDVVEAERTLEIAETGSNAYDLEREARSDALMVAQLEQVMDVHREGLSTLFASRHEVESVVESIRARVEAGEMPSKAQMTRLNRAIAHADGKGGVTTQRFGKEINRESGASYRTKKYLSDIQEAVADVNMSAEALIQSQVDALGDVSSQFLTDTPMDDIDRDVGKHTRKERNAFSKALQDVERLTENAARDVARDTNVDHGLTNSSLCEREYGVKSKVMAH